MGIVNENHDARINKLAREEEEIQDAESMEELNADKPVLDPASDLTDQDLELLKEAEYDDSSDETRASDLLDDTDDEGDELNEGPDEDNKFDMGEDLDMPQDLMNPDHDLDEEEE